MNKQDIKILKASACEVFDKNYTNPAWQEKLYVADYDYKDENIVEKINVNGGWEYFLEECKRHGYEFYNFVDGKGNCKYITYCSDSIIKNEEYGEYNRKVLEMLGVIGYE